MFNDVFYHSVRAVLWTSPSVLYYHLQSHYQVSHNKSHRVQYLQLCGINQVEINRSMTHGHYLLINQQKEASINKNINEHFLLSPTDLDIMLQLAIVGTVLGY